jgi:hypothetical protein
MIKVLTDGITFSLSQGESRLLALLLIGMESVDRGRKRITWNNVIRAVESFRKAGSVKS